MTHHRSWLAAALLGLTLASCSAPVDPRGNLPTPEELSQIKPGVTDKATVSRILGSPSTIATFDDSTWYYISQKTRIVAFFKPELLDQQVVAIDFDKSGLVTDIRRRGLNDRVAVEPNPNATPAPGRELTFMQQLIGNFGRFSSDQPTTPGGGTGGPGH
ncbi:MAG TPA: outer membrane protein assembly factor BamE [Stellaceae bacterium]|nr:outer membrane protein assembly factor BamE [Stellaceae bacterium]